MTTKTLFPVLWLLVSLSACKSQESAPPVSADSQAPVAAGAEGIEAPGEVPEPAPVPEPMVPVLVAAITSSGGRIVLQDEGQTSGIPADARFEITSAHALSEVRIRLLNGNDKLVPSDDKAVVGRGFRYELTPREGLEQEAAYRIVVDEAATGRPRDVTGQVYQGRSFRFMVGEPATGPEEAEPAGAPAE